MAVSRSALSSEYRSQYVRALQYAVLFRLNSKEYSPNESPSPNVLIGVFCGPTSTATRPASDQIVTDENSPTHSLRFCERVT